MMMTALLFVGATAALLSPPPPPSPAGFRLSSTLGNGMVLQRAPASAVVFGFASANLSVHTKFGEKTLVTKADAFGIWRQVLPPTAATKTEQTLVFTSSEGTAELDVLFGEVRF